MELKDAEKVLVVGGLWASWGNVGGINNRLALNNGGEKNNCVALNNVADFFDGGETGCEHTKGLALNKRPQKNQKWVLKNISVKVEPGKIVCVCGSNGAGKSTFLKALFGGKFNGLNWVADFGPMVNGYSLKNLSPLEKARKIAVLWQNEGTVFDYSVMDVMLTGRYCRSKIPGVYSINDRKFVKDVADQLGISDLLEKSIFEISGGELQKVRIGRCLCQEPDFLILDEPFANLDMVSESKLICLLQKLAAEHGIGILVTVHNLNTANLLGDEFVLIGKNCGEQVACGGAEKVFTQENLQKAYGGEWEFGQKFVWGVSC